MLRCGWHSVYLENPGNSFLFLRSEQKLAKLPCRRILLSQTVEEAFEAGCGISGTVDSTYLNVSRWCQDLLVEMGVPLDLIEEKLLVTQTGKRLLEWENWENTTTREENGGEWQRMEENGTDWLSLLIHKGKAENEKLDKFSVALQGKIFEQGNLLESEMVLEEFICEKPATTQHLEVTLASVTYNEVKPSMSFPGLSRQVVKSSSRGQIVACSGCNVKAWIPNTSCTRKRWRLRSKLGREDFKNNVKQLAVADYLCN